METKEVGNAKEDGAPCGEARGRMRKKKGHCKTMGKLHVNVERKTGKSQLAGELEWA